MPEPRNPSVRQDIRNTPQQQQHKKEQQQNEEEPEEETVDAEAA